MPVAKSPRKGSLQYWPRKRARKFLPRVNWNIINSEKEGLRGFICYKVGMKSALVKDTTENSMTKGKRIAVPVTILECPPMKILSVRFYKNGTVKNEIINDEVIKDKDAVSFNQPQAVFVYNQKQVSIPVRYLQYEDKVLDFGGGLDAVIKVIPQVSQATGQQSVQIDKIGAAIYLSPKVSKGLFAQLYLLGDPFKKYGTVTLAHSQPDPIVDNLNKQGARLGDMVFFSGFRGPLKIWKVDYPNNILAKEEFLRTSGEFAEFDNLQFVA